VHPISLSQAAVGLRVELAAGFKSQGTGTIVEVLASLLAAVPTGLIARAVARKIWGGGGECSAVTADREGVHPSMLN